jgi:hypothetical protein
VMLIFAGCPRFTEDLSGILLIHLEPCPTV